MSPSLDLRPLGTSSQPYFATRILGYYAEYCTPFPFEANSYGAEFVCLCELLTRGVHAEVRRIDLGVDADHVEGEVAAVRRKYLPEKL